MDFLADDELTLNQDDPRFKPKSQRGNFADGALGTVSGIAMGTIEAATAPDSIIRGDKKAAALRAQNLEIFKPDDLGGVGEFTYGLTKDFTRIGWNAVTTLGTGGVPGLALNSGLFGYQTFEAEKSDLLNKGADIKTARTGGAIKGVTDALGFAIPTHGVSKSVIADAIATTALSTAAGSAGDYLEGSYLEDHKNKKVAQYGEALKENAVSPSTLAANGGMALLLNLWANKGRLRPDQVKDHSNVDAMNDAAHIQANVEHAEGSNPFSSTNPKEVNSHFDALDSAMESALNDELVSLKVPVTGSPKAIVTGTPVVPITGTPKAIVRPVPLNADEHRAQVFTNPILDKKPWAKTIAQEASKRGINPVDALVLSHIENAGTFDPKIQPKDKDGNLLSSATGLFQTIDSTFARMGGKNKFDGNDQVKAGLNYYEHNAKVFRNQFKRDPNGLELYYLHFFGEGGGPVFLKAKDNELFVDVATRWSKGNEKKTARQIAEGITASHKFNGMTVGQVKAKYQKRWDEVARQYEGVGTLSDDNGSTAVRGSESEFPEFESDIAAPPTYKSQSDAEVEAMPFVLTTDEHSVKSMIEEFEALSSPLTKEDLEYLKATAHYQYSQSSAYRAPYTEPQIDLSGPSNSANRTLDTLDSDLQQLAPEQQVLPEQQLAISNAEFDNPNLNKGLPESINQQNLIIEGVDNWASTRSQNYLKRERVREGGSLTQELHNKASNTTFQRQINQDGTITPVKATRNGNDLFAHPANSKADSPELTAVQHKATQALEREFWKPSKSKVDGAPDLTKSSKGEYGAFTDTPDGREAVSIMEADPDMEVTFTRMDENGNEEIVTMSSRDLLDYVKEQEEIAKDEIQAVKALASCALKFGSEAA